MSTLFRKKSIDKIVADSEAGLTDSHHQSLNRVLTVKDLTFMGIAAIIGAGIFSTIGTAAFNGGPGIAFLFIITAITCGFSALCYAEFASRVPIAGSAYTYAYVSFGELIAWIIGWALILEYAIGNIVVAISWSGYFNNLLMGLGIHLPGWLLTDPFSAAKDYQEAIAFTTKNQPLPQHLTTAIDTWTNAPVFLGKHILMNLPAFIIVVLITILAYVGIKESKKSTNFMVIFKIIVIIFVIVLGFFYVKPANWSPFLPNGFGGVLAGVSAVFYAYIGFDAISTTAEECKNPQRDLPRGMIYSLIICTVLYILIALVLTGMVHYSELKVNDPLAFVFSKINLPWVSYIISISAVVATTSVMLVFQLGQPRIWMSMSRDGLLPKKFAQIHPKFHTPAFSTIITGFLVAIPALILPSSLMTDLTSIGTLFAFVLVCFGVLVLPKMQNAKQGRFKLPYINGKFIIPILAIFFIIAFHQRLSLAFEQMNTESYQEILFIVFVAILVVVAILSFLKNYSTIPVLGALFCLYLMIEIPAISWMWFFIWMGLGLCLYFFYGRKHSNLCPPNINC
ncbi:amino acid permease [Hydrotalea sandarakina]|jgi:amino acid transporter|uniref:Amino acid transporter n=1 Tax=Hydrotalea sandarakina TaxID=1004304 RepID=A0A2W7RYP0_9BACT|nr:amino acid permease [Hydrotalea sandarakina]PZX65883.1 amino acid transporter [Hydrotalea sandarakina]